MCKLLTTVIDCNYRYCDFFCVQTQNQVYAKLFLYFFLVFETCSPLHLICRSSHSPKESQFGDGAGPDRWTEHEYVVRLALLALVTYYISSPSNQQGTLELFATQNANGNTPLMEAVTCLSSDMHKDRHHRAGTLKICVLSSLRILYIIVCTILDL